MASASTAAVRLLKRHSGTIVGIDSVTGIVKSFKGFLKAVVGVMDSPDEECPEDLDKLAREFVRAMGWPKLNVSDILWTHYKKQIEALIATLGFVRGVRQLYAKFDENLAAANRRLIQIMSESVDDYTAAQLMERALDFMDPLVFAIYFLTNPLTEMQLFLFKKVFLPRFSALRVVELSEGRPRVFNLRQLAAFRDNVQLLQAIDDYTQTENDVKIRADILRFVKDKCDADTTLQTIEDDKGNEQMLQYRNMCADTVMSLIGRRREVASHLLLCSEKAPDFKDSLRRVLVEIVKSGEPLYAKSVALDSMCCEVYAAVVRSAADAIEDLCNAPEMKAAMEHELEGKQNSEAFKELCVDPKFATRELLHLQQSGFVPKHSATHCLLSGFKRVIRTLHATNEAVNKANVDFDSIKDMGRVKLTFEQCSELRDALEALCKEWANSGVPLQRGEYRFKLARVENGYGETHSSSKVTQLCGVKLFVEIAKNSEGVIQQVYGEVHFFLKSTTVLQRKSHWFHEVTRDSKRWTKVLRGADNFKLSTLNHGADIVAVLRSDFHEDDASEVFAVFRKVLVSADIGEIDVVANWAEDNGWPKLDAVLFATMVQMKSCHPEFGAVLELVSEKVGIVKFQELVEAKHKDQCAIGRYLRHAAQFSETVAQMLWPTGGTRLLHTETGFSVYHYAAYACVLYGCGAERIAWLNKKKRVVRDLRSLRPVRGNLALEVYMRGGGRLPAVVEALSFEGMDSDEMAAAQSAVDKLHI